MPDSSSAEDGGVETRLSLRAADGTRLVVAPDAGGRIASLHVAGEERLVTSPKSDPRVDWGCYLMAPWVGRLAHARLPLGDATYKLVANHGRHAIHGVALDADWHVVDAAADRATLTADLGGAGWPLGGEVREEVTLAPGHVRLSATVTAGALTTPAALGWHPWFARPADGDLALRCDADRVLVTDDELIPDGTTTPVAGSLDLRAGPALGDRRLDHCYVGVREPVTIAWPDLTLTISAGTTTYVVHSPARGVCAEPQTAWPNAPCLDAGGLSGTGLAYLEPRTSLTLVADLTW